MKLNRWVTILLVALVASLIHTQLFYYPPIGERIEPWSLDLWFNLRGEIDPPEQVMLVAMDEDSYEELNLAMDTAWPRAVHARLLRRLAKAGVRRVIFDVAFLGESSSKKADAELAKALGLLPTVIGADSGTSVGAFKIEEVFLPLDAFVKKVETVALVGLPEDAGVVRRFKTKRTGRTERYPTLAEAGAGVNRETDELPGEHDFIAYYGPAGTIPTFSYYEVLDPEIMPDEELKDKIIYVGLLLRTDIGPAQKDSYMTPFWERGRIFGVEIHAASAANLMTKNWIRRAAPWKEGLVLGIVAFVTTAVLFFLRPQWAGLVLILFIAGWACAAFSSFLGGFFLPGVVLCVIMLPTMYLISTLYFYFVSHRAQKQTQKAFEMYLSPEMAREVGKDPKALGLGGENIYATALFTDIADFTKITEGMLAEDTADMLNSYFSEVMGVIFDNSGTLIKFIGDSVFAIWGAPVKLADHAEKAVRTAIMIQQEVQKFNASGRFKPLLTRIGVHTGPMVVGNLGSDRRFDYTAIGDSVNLSSRVEGLNKYFGTQILITDGTKKELVSNTKTYKMGSVSVAGKSAIVPVHAIFTNPLSDLVEEKWLIALSEFNSKNWDKAETLFGEAKAVEERLEKASSLYLEQIKELRQQPPDREWMGEISFSTK
jgi:adenylate cyclase